MLPDCSADKALERAERAERARTQVCSEVQGFSPATISLGVAQLDAETENYSDRILHADQALCEAKRLGRNRTVCFSGLQDQGQHLVADA